ncbi:hypothetical protein [Kitasatospora sp. NPDC050543]|uniref:hypothetical protein n=1 Tax=Kitasatospora sp. NPDC050543 TaxID=3364054 RepID=UPI00379A80B4
MSSTTPAPGRAPRDRVGEPARTAPGVPMRALLAACAAAEAVSTPPERLPSVPVPVPVPASQPQPPAGRESPRAA